VATLSSTSSATSTSSIDVASIVSQLMTAANKPLDSVKSQIASENLAISDLGTLKSKLSTFRDALKSFETPGTFNTVSASSNNTTVATASALSGTTLGRYNLTINQTAEASNISVAGFTTASDVLTLDATNGFTLSVAGKSYQSNQTYTSTSNPATTGGTLSAISSNTSTLTDLKNWINAVGANFSAPIGSSVVQTSTGAYSLAVTGTATGVANTVSFSGLNGSSITTAVSGIDSSLTIIPTVGNGGIVNGGALTISSNTNARDAKLTVNGLAIQRSSNAISDVVSGLTINLQSPVLSGGTPQSALITVGAGSDTSNVTINSLITAYNGVISQYKSMTLNAGNGGTSETTGSYGNAPGMLGFISSFKQMISQGFLTSTNKVVSMGSIGIDMQLDGTLKFNSTKFAAGQTDGSIAYLSSGVSVGGAVGSPNNLSLSLASVVNPAGMLDNLVTTQKTKVTYMTSKQASLQTRLDKVRADYTQQYSQLNTLLFNLSQTSSQLTSSIAGLTSNYGK
jgi:flagellar hook-associated protein 2